MICYGQNEDWYKRIVPSGMLPAAEIDGRIVTESSSKSSRPCSGRSANHSP